MGSLYSGTAFFFSPTPITAVIAQGQEEEGEEEQIIISNDNFQNYTRYGEYTKFDYIQTYTPLKLFDNLLPNQNITHTYWSEFGNAGFTIFLKSPLQKSVCSVEIYDKEPRNAQVVLKLGNEKRVIQGKLNATLNSINLLECVKDVQKIKFDVKANNQWTTLAEIKLFSKQKLPPIEPPYTCPAGQHFDIAQNKCVPDSIPPPPLLPPPPPPSPSNNATTTTTTNTMTTITNSTLKFDVSNSTLEINADTTSDILINVGEGGGNVTIIAPPLQQQPEQAQTQEQQDNDNDNDKDKKEDNDKKLKKQQQQQQQQKEKDDNEKEGDN